MMKKDEVSQCNSAHNAHCMFFLHDQSTKCYNRSNDSQSNVNILLVEQIDYCASLKLLSLVFFHYAIISLNL